MRFFNNAMEWLFVCENKINSLFHSVLYTNCQVVWCFSAQTDDSTHATQRVSVYLRAKAWEIFEEKNHNESVENCWNDI